jgi:hypothetical protein
LEHTVHICLWTSRAVSMILHQGWVDSTEIVRPAKPKIFTFWLFTEKNFFCSPLLCRQSPSWGVRQTSLWILALPMSSEWLWRSFFILLTWGHFSLQKGAIKYVW